MCVHVTVEAYVCGNCRLLLNFEEAILVFRDNAKELHSQYHSITRLYLI